MAARLRRPKKLNASQLDHDLTAAGITVEGVTGVGRGRGVRDGDHYEPARRYESLRRGPRVFGYL